MTTIFGIFIWKVSAVIGFLFGVVQMVLFYLVPQHWTVPFFATICSLQFGQKQCISVEEKKNWNLFVGSVCGNIAFSSVCGNPTHRKSR